MAKSRSFENRQRINSKSFGEVAEWPNAVVLKTIECNSSQGSNPCLSTIYKKTVPVTVFLYPNIMQTLRLATASRFTLSLYLAQHQTRGNSDNFTAKQ